MSPDLRFGYELDPVNFCTREEFSVGSQREVKKNSFEVRVAVINTYTGR
jgi:hypothetical protein